MKIVLDTNVFVAGVLFHGFPHQILRAWRDGKLQLAASREIMEEYEKVAAQLACGRPLFDFAPVLQLVKEHAEMHSVQCRLEPLSRDPAAEKFLACALASKSNALISSNKHLLELAGFPKLMVLKPAKFVEAYLH